MSLFGGDGFLGLEGSKFGETVSDIGESLEEGAEFFLEAPNKIIDIGEQLGGRTYDTQSETAQKFKEEATRFRSRQVGGNIGQGIGSFLSNNLAIIGVGLIALFIFKD